MNIIIYKQKVSEWISMYACACVCVCVCARASVCVRESAWAGTRTDVGGRPKLVYLLYVPHVLNTSAVMIPLPLHSPASAPSCMTVVVFYPVIISDPTNPGDNKEFNP